MKSQLQFKRRFSFEFFPPKTEEGKVKLQTVRDELARRKPDFFSVTYGAGGSTQERTIDTVLNFQDQGIATAPHLSCVGSTKENITQLLDMYKERGVNRIVALRGDLPSGMGGAAGELKYANELVEFIRAHSGNHFNIEVAAYPEFHPQAPSADADLLNFKRKAEAGASSAITQYFFNADSYFYFIDRIEALGVSLPVVPGIMPIINFNNLEHKAIVNDLDLAYEACLQGMGITGLPSYIAAKHIASGDLVQLFKDVDIPERTIQIVFPQNRYLSNKSRAFLDFATAYFNESK